MNTNKSEQRRTIRRQVLKYLAIITGSVIYGLAFQLFLFPNHIVGGGLVGVSMIINSLTGLPVGAMTFLLNIPLFVIAWRHFGLDFIISSLVGMGLTSLFVDLFAAIGVVATADPMLGAIIGGVIKGAGLGLVYNVGTTTGGIDIVIKLLRRKYSHINFGTIMLSIDVVIIIAYGLALRAGTYESAMYSLISMFVATKVVDLVLYGFDNASLCYIISEDCESLTRAITSGQMHRGVTVLDGEGAWSHAKRPVILCVIKRNQIPELRRLVREIDPRAFLIVSDAKNVFGNGFENIAEVR